MTAIPPHIMTSNGDYFDLLNPSKSKFTIYDIAHALSMVCRFNGHTNEFYSVAQHSVHVSRLVPEEHALAGLLHDASEAFMGDVTLPLKQLLPNYKKLEASVQAEILSRFNLPAELPSCVKKADLIALASEVHVLMPREAREWGIIRDTKKDDKLIEPLPPEKARSAFLARFDSLTGIEIIEPRLEEKKQGLTSWCRRGKLEALIKTA